MINKEWSKEWKDELRNIKDPNGITFIDKLGQHEVLAIEKFISKLFNDMPEDLITKLR